MKRLNRGEFFKLANRQLDRHKKGVHYQRPYVDGSFCIHLQKQDYMEAQVRLFDINDTKNIFKLLLEDEKGTTC